MFHHTNLILHSNISYWTTKQACFCKIPTMCCVSVFYIITKLVETEVKNKNKGTVRWDLGDPISSGYLAHCSHLFSTSIRIVLSAFYIYVILESFDTDFADQTVYKSWILPVSSETLVPITAILISAADCVLLLHQLAIGPVTVHLMKWFLNARITLNVWQTGHAVASQLGFEPGLLVQLAGSLPTKPSGPVKLRLVYIFLEWLCFQMIRSVLLRMWMHCGMLWK